MPVLKELKQELLLSIEILMFVHSVSRWLFDLVIPHPDRSAPAFYPQP